MRISRAAIRYSKASLEYAIEKKVTSIIKNDFEYILLVLSNSDELNKFLPNPVISSRLKLDILHRIFPNLSKTTKSVIKLLSNKRRLSILGQVAEDFIHRLKIYEGKTTATVTTAVPLNEELKALVQEKVKSISNELNVELINKVDPSIVGGMIINIEGKELNASVTNQIESYRRSLISNKNIA